jgi:hypothetical protein
VSQTISTTFRARDGAAGNPPTVRCSRSDCQPVETIARTPSTPRIAAVADRTLRESSPRVAIARLIGPASPAASSRLHPAYIGILKSAPQIATVASSHDPTRSETSLGSQRLRTAIANPGITIRAA